MTMLEEKTFILGVGVQKAGTTWLYDYLAAQHGIWLSPLKEMHYFDAKYRPEFEARFDRIFQKKRRILRRQQLWPTQRRREKLAHVNARLAMRDDAAYRQYFETFTPHEAACFGEVTPSYALLPEQGFQDIANLFPKVRIVLLLRDPVERLYSQLRMNLRRRPAQDGERKAFIAALDKTETIDRADYGGTICRLRKVFPAEAIHIGFYETMFSDEETARLCRFLDIPFRSGNYGHRANAAPRPAMLDADLIAMARERFAAAYAFCREEFGERVPVNWHV